VFVAGFLALVHAVQVDKVGVGCNGHIAVNDWRKLIVVQVV
jgi:hypothetical protein